MDEREKKIIHRIIERLDLRIAKLVRVRNRFAKRFEEEESNESEQFGKRDQ